MGTEIQMFWLKSWNVAEEIWRKLKMIVEERKREMKKSEFNQSLFNWPRGKHSQCVYIFRREH